jgi:hypothetical protein
MSGRGSTISAGGAAIARSSGRARCCNGIELMEIPHAKIRASGAGR